MAQVRLRLRAGIFRTGGDRRQHGAHPANPRTVGGIVTRYYLTDGTDQIVAGAGLNVVYAASATLTEGDVIRAAPYSHTALVLQDGNHFDLSAPAELTGIDIVADRSFGNSVIDLRDGLTITLQLGQDSATVYGADDAATIVGGAGYATLYLGSAREHVLAGPAGATVMMQTADAGATIRGRGVTVVRLGGAYGDAVRLGAEIEGVAELDIASAGLKVTVGAAGIATVALFAQNVTLQAGAHTRLITDYAGGNVIVFSGPGQVLRLPYAGAAMPLPPDTITQFGPGDAIDIDLPYGPDEVLSYDVEAGMLTLTDSDSGAAQSVHVAGVGAPSFRMGPDAGMPSGDTGTLISLSGAELPHASAAPCFAAGTHILTEQGWMRVERLRVGDRLITHAGAMRPLRWIGQRAVDCRLHPNPRMVLPIRVRAGAFGQRLPHADLVVSPDHAVFLDGALIPVQYLVNGATISREQAARVDYFHLELDRHDVILAEGLPVESYLDTGNRAQFANAAPAITLHPDFAARIWPPHACAPLITAGPALLRVRAALFARAARLGYTITDDPDLRVFADGQRVWGSLGGQGWRGWIPPGVQALRIVSRAAAPADCRLDSDDRRPLGVALRAVSITAPGSRRRLAPDDPGWGRGFYSPEHDDWASWRWTDGDAVLLPCTWAGLTGPFRLDLELFGRIGYRLDPAPEAASPGRRASS